MKNLNKQIDDLIVKYNIDKHYPRFRDRMRAISLIQKFVEQYLLGKQVLVAAANREELEFFWRDSGIEAGRSFIFGENGTTIKVDDISQVNRVIIVSNNWSKEISLQIKNINKELEIVCLYDFFCLQGLYLTGDYYDVFASGYHISMGGKRDYGIQNQDLNAICYYDRKCYQYACDEGLRKFYLEKLIFDYIYIKDFISLFQAINEYADQYMDSSVYREFEEELIGIINDLKKMLKDKKSKDIFMLWLDQLEYGEDDEMPFLKGLTDKALDFTNAYTITPYTELTAFALFCGKYVIEDKSYLIQTIDSNSSIIMKELQNKGYEFKFYSFDIPNTSKTNMYINEYTPVSLMLWQSINDVAQTDKMRFSIVHESIHTHMPNVSPNLTGNTYIYQQLWSSAAGVEEKKYRTKQRKESRLYLDQQLEFYSAFLPDNMYKVYMSDHGHSVMGKYHAIMRICQKEIMPQSVKGIFSFIKFGDLLRYIVGTGQVCSVEELVTDYAVIQDVDYYNGLNIKRLIDAKYIDEYSYGYQGVITKSDMYIRYNDGSQEYMKHENDGKMMNQERISYLQTLLLQTSIDVESDAQFRYSKYVYRILRKYQSRAKDNDYRMICQIKNLFDDIPLDKRVAVRGGGVHTFRLLMLLEDRQRKRIQYIIDTDKKCLAGHIGIPCIHPNMLGYYKLDVVIISSFFLKEEWKKELELSNYKMKIIELYEYLREKGFDCNKEFFRRKFVDEDFEVGFPSHVESLRR